MAWSLMQAAALLERSVCLLCLRLYVSRTPPDDTHPRCPSSLPHTCAPPTAVRTCSAQLLSESRIRHPSAPPESRIPKRPHLSMSSGRGAVTTTCSPRTASRPGHVPVTSVDAMRLMRTGARREAVGGCSDLGTEGQGDGTRRGHGEAGRRREEGRDAAEARRDSRPGTGNRLGWRRKGAATVRHGDDESRRQHVTAAACHGGSMSRRQHVTAAACHGGT
jgi:hypothetical protein